MRIGNLLMLCVILVKVVNGRDSSPRKADAVKLGFPISFSSVHNAWYWANVQLDMCYHDRCAWCPRYQTAGDWIQVTSEKPRIWTDLILQTQGAYNAWITSFQLSYSIDGFTWNSYKYGLNIPTGLSAPNQKNMVSLDPPIRARALKITVTEYYHWPCLRFGALFID